MDYVVAVAAPYGGPIAVKRDETKIVKVQGSEHLTISLFTGSGRPMGPSIKWTRKPVIKMGWTNDEQFICIQDDGLIVLHDIFGKFVSEFSICQEIRGSIIKDTKIFTSKMNTTGVAVQTSKDKIYVVDNILSTTPVIQHLADIPKSNCPVTSWVVISDDTTEVLLAREKELYRIKSKDITLLELDITQTTNISILEMAVSINSRHIVLFTNSGLLWLGSSDLRRKYCEIDTNIVFPPNQLVWCGNEAIVAFWEANRSLLIVGRNGDKSAFEYDSSVCLVPEIDGVRVLSTSQHELIQKIPDVVQKIFKINSTDPGCFLLEASKEFQKRSHRADEYICLVKDNLLKAVEQCTEAAGYEFDPDVQKILIRAAQFGKCFISGMNPEAYVRMCRVLRVLNSVRDRKIGIPLTITQLQHISEQALLAKLERRRHYCLAICAAKYLRLPDPIGRSRILLHWAKYKVARLDGKDEEQVAREIAEKLGQMPGISYSDIANVATDAGKRRIAIKLLDYETQASKQVNLLLKLEERTQALQKAIESGNTDLIYHVIMKLRASMSLIDFKMAIRKFPVSQALYIKYCRQYEPHAVAQIYKEEDDFNSQAEENLNALLPLNEKSVSEVDMHLTEAITAYKKDRNDFYAQLCEDTNKLFKQQKQLKEKLHQPVEGQSIHDTCKKLLDLNELKLAEKFKTDFKIPDRRYWWLKIQSFADTNQWDELEKFARLKKSPIGYAPFVDVCLEKGKNTEALKYLPKVADEIKVKYYVKAGQIEEAIQIAFDQRDMPGLLQIQSRIPVNSAANDKINNLIAQLSSSTS